MFKQSALAELDSILAELATSSKVGIDEELPFKSLALLQPYKKYLLNVVDALHFVTLSMIYWLLLSDVYLTLLNRGNNALGLIAFLSILPCVYVVSLTAYWVCCIKKLPQWLYLCSNGKRMGVQQSDSSVNKEQEPDSQTPLCQPANDDTFADRLANPTAYDALIPARRKALSHKQTSTLLVHEETQTSGRFSSIEVTVTPKEENVVLPWQPPTSSVIEVEDSWGKERGVIECEVKVI